VRYEMMLPAEIRTAISEGWPAVLPLGVLEYHGEHMAVGMDGLAVVKALEILEGEAPLVVLPAFWYGAASYAVEPPEGTGTLHVDSAALLPLAEEVFGGLLRIGFRNVHCFIHHQTENFAVGMPTDLAFKFAARRTIFRFLEKTRGEGWWGRPESADYYAAQAAGDDPFNWIRVHPLLDEGAIAAYPFDHAGEGETSLMLAMCPQAVRMDRLADGPWYTASAARASADTGARGRDLVLAHMRRVLRLAPTAGHGAPHGGSG
jgi:creatinine amidohydrolase/Fe(II)-dependent formamide hydrolase-like protein